MIVQTVGVETLHNLYNIGSGVGTSVNEILETLAKVSGKKLVIDERPVPSTFIDKVVLNTGRHRQEFGNFSLTPLSEGIQLTLDGLDN